MVKFGYNKGGKIMRKVKLCCFTVNTTHALIIANNFIENELNNVKIIYINDKNLGQSCQPVNNN